MTVDIRVGSVVRRYLQMAYVGKGRHVYHVGESPRDPNQCFLVVNGGVLLHKTTVSGKRVAFGAVLPGQLFGEEVLFDTPRRHDATAIIHNTAVARLEITQEVRKELLSCMRMRYAFVEAVLMAEDCTAKMVVVKECYPTLQLSLVEVASLINMSREMVNRKAKRRDFRK